MIFFDSLIEVHVSEYTSSCIHTHFLCNDISKVWCDLIEIEITSMLTWSGKSKYFPISRNTFTQYIPISRNTFTQILGGSIHNDFTTSKSYNYTCIRIYNSTCKPWLWISCYQSIYLLYLRFLHCRQKFSKIQAPLHIFILYARPSRFNRCLGSELWSAIIPISNHTLFISFTVYSIRVLVLSVRKLGNLDGMSRDIQLGGNLGYSSCNTYINRF